MMRNVMVCIVVSLLTAATGSAAFIGLDPDTGCIQVSDKLFCDFTDFGSGLPDATVTGIGGTTLHPGIVFQGAFASTVPIDWAIGYTATVVDEFGDPTGQELIKDIELAFNTNSIGAGGSITVTEKAWENDFFSGFLARSTIEFTTGGGVDDPEDPPGETTQSDILDLPYPVTKVYITKDILLTPLACGGIGASLISQRLSQVPEPGFYGVMTLGLAGLFLVVTRRRKMAG